MKLYHTTTRRVLSAVLRDGLRPDKSKGRLKVAWLHSQARTAWACVHFSRKHGGAVEQMVRICVNVPRAWLKRYAAGIWHTDRVVPPDRIVSVRGYAAYDLPVGGRV